MTDTTTTTLFRPVGPEELELIRQSGFRAFPPRLPEQPIFYPVLTEDYAVKIARDWNVRASGAGHVTRFEVRTSFLAGYGVQTAGGSAYREYWIPAEDLDAWRTHLVALGVAIEYEETWPRGGHSLYFRDPAGNSVELITPGLWGLPSGW